MYNPTNQQVVGGFNRKEKWALAHLYKEYRASVYELARRLLNNETDAEDVTSEAFIKLLQVRERKKTIKEIRDLLHVSTFNLALDMKKTAMKERKRTVYFALDQPLTDEEEVKTAEWGAVLWQHLYAKVNKLTPPCRLVFERYYRDEKSIPEVARELNISEKTVFNRKSQAMRIMRFEMTTHRSFIFSITIMI